MDNLTKYLKSKSKDLIGGVPGLAHGYENEDKYVQDVAKHWYNIGGRQISYSHKQQGYYLMNHYSHELDDYGFPYEDWDATSNTKLDISL
jgi:hypothetical protein